VTVTRRATVSVVVMVIEVSVVVMITLEILLLFPNISESILTDLHFTYSSELRGYSRYALQGILPANYT
jgi:hypothetical protein